MEYMIQQHPGMGPIHRKTATTTAPGVPRRIQPNYLQNQSQRNTLHLFHAATVPTHLREGLINAATASDHGVKHLSPMSTHASNCRVFLTMAFTCKGVGASEEKKKRKKVCVVGKLDQGLGKALSLPLLMLKEVGLS